MKISSDQQHVEFTTALGGIVISVDRAAAPLTASNFLTYVCSGFFDRTAFYRVVAPCNQKGNAVPISVVQGGWREDVTPPLPPIPHEPTCQTGLRHRDGVVSMARLAPGTAAGAFFICIGDHPQLDYGGARNPDQHGFAAFGEVVQGMDVVRAIWARAEQEQFLSEPIAIERALLSRRRWISVD
ncbi:peptidylprolyl isomerase [Phenylobacterium zucineum]|nr:peptidylprolyl isomerase [Phenylobacterium zucineum]